MSSRARAQSAHHEAAKCTGAGNWQVDVGRHVDLCSTSGSIHVRSTEAILRLSIARRVPGGRRGARWALHEVWQLILDRILQDHHMPLLAVLVIQQLRLLRGLRGGRLDRAALMLCGIAHAVLVRTKRLLTARLK